jgi:hypothetical protein
METDETIFGTMQEGQQEGARRKRGGKSSNADEGKDREEEGKVEIHTRRIWNCAGFRGAAHS